MVRRGSLQVVKLLAPSMVSRVLGWSALTLGFALFLWTSPASPVALWRADVWLGHGRPYDAALLYDRIAQLNPLPHLRAAALERSALTWSVELGDPHEARDRLEERLHQWMAEPDRADLLQRIGELLLLEGEQLEAARRFREAHDLAPFEPEATERLARAARAAATADDLDLAARLWRRLGQTHPEALSRAELGLANVALSRGDVEGALVAYENAVDHAFDADVASVASLGAATCLERLGNLDLALAQLEEADLPDAVRASRAAQIKARGAIK
ncbi:MAG: tetratricopeptide repeat protein [Myxococcota bacterium]